MKFTIDKAKEDLLYIADKLGIKQTVTNDELKPFDYSGVDLTSRDLIGITPTIKETCEQFDNSQDFYNYDEPLVKLLTFAYQIGMQQCYHKVEKLQEEERQRQFNLQKMVDKLKEED